MRNKLLVLLFLLGILSLILVGCGGPPPTNGNGEQFTLTVNVEGNGTVEPDGGKFDKGAVVTLTVAPAEGEDFVGWRGQDSAHVLEADGTGKYKITMDRNKETTA